jgi:16S rRNA processing protein RimM
VSADLRLVGRVARAHGNRGQVIVNLETDFAEERFKAGNVLLVGPEASATPREIVSARFHLGRPVIGLSGIETMNEAEGLAGAELWMPAAALEPLPLGTYYRHDLVGCEVRDAKGHAVGIVREVEGTLERSYLVVDGECGEVMIPMVAEICRTIDIPARRIDVVLPEGLVEINPTRISRGGGAKSGQRTAERDRP